MRQILNPKYYLKGSQTEEKSFLSLLGQVKQNSLTEHIGHFWGMEMRFLCSIYSLVMWDPVLKPSEPRFSHL